MPKMTGMEVAKHILAANPRQRIISASTFVNETLVESIKHLNQIVETFAKAIRSDTVGDMLEDKGIYEELEALNVRIKDIRNLNPTHEQVRDLLTGLRKLQK